VVGLDEAWSMALHLQSPFPMEIRCCLWKVQ
jgi:hypothetical protein